MVGRGKATARDFWAVGCTTVWLAGGRSVHVFGETPAGCVATWSGAGAAPGGGALLTAAAPGGPPVWQLALPSDGTPARLTCASFCPIAFNAAPCTAAQAGGLRLPGAGVGAGAAASAGAGAASTAPPAAPVAQAPPRRHLSAFGGYGTTTPPATTAPPPPTTAPPPPPPPPPGPANPAARVLEVARAQQDALQAQAEQGATDLINEWRNVLGQIG